MWSALGGAVEEQPGDGQQRPDARQRLDGMVAVVIGEQPCGDVGQAGPASVVGQQQPPPLPSHAQLSGGIQTGGIQIGGGLDGRGRGGLALAGGGEQDGRSPDPCLDACSGLSPPCRYQGVPVLNKSPDTCQQADPSDSCNIALKSSSTYPSLSARVPRTAKWTAITG